MSSKYPWNKLDTKPLRWALAKRKIPRLFYIKTISKIPNILSAMERIEQASGVSPFPTTVLVPEGVYDFEFKVVVHAHLTLYKSNSFSYPVIELSAPSILYMPESWFLGLLGHEFLHYVVYTIKFHKKLVELKSKGDSKSPAIVGVIPDKEKMTLEERDRYFYGNPDAWFKDDDVIQAIKKLESEIESSSAREMADKVKNWMNEKRLMKEFKRGEIVSVKGKLWLHDSILEKARKSGLLD